MFGLFKNDSANVPSLSEGLGVAGALSVLLGVFGDALTYSTSDEMKRRRGVSLLDGRDPYTRELNAADQFGTGP